MYVCICKAVTDKQIQEYRQQGVNSFRELRECTGIATQCGKCTNDARSCFSQSSSVSPVSLYAS
ncbi:MAG: (2Fe-2S)-binding protein [Gammaproteobacteria bacterium]